MEVSSILIILRAINISDNVTYPEAVVLLILGSSTMAKSRQGIYNHYGTNNGVTKALKNLIDQGYVEEIKIHERIFFQITPEGMGIYYRILSATI